MTLHAVMTRPWKYPDRYYRCITGDGLDKYFPTMPIRNVVKKQWKQVGLFMHGRNEITHIHNINYEWAFDNWDRSLQSYDDYLKIRDKFFLSFDDYIKLLEDPKPPIKDKKPKWNW